VVLVVDVDVDGDVNDDVPLVEGDDGGGVLSSGVECNESLWVLLLFLLIV